MVIVIDVLAPVVHGKKFYNGYIRASLLMFKIMHN